MACNDNGAAASMCMFKKGMRNGAAAHMIPAKE